MTRRHLISASIAIALLGLSCGDDPFAHIADRAVPAAAPTDSSHASARLQRVADVLDRLHTGLSQEELARTAASIVAEARRTRLPEDLVLAVIQVESSGNAFAVSHVGAMGLMQLRPDTAEEVANRLGIVWTGDALLFDPVTNVRLGTEYLRALIERYGDIPTALAAYNWGPTRIGRKMRRGEAIPAAYANRVMAKVSAGKEI